MRELEIRISCESEAFGLSDNSTCAELVRCLSWVADSLEREMMHGNIVDINGVVVGFWAFESGRGYE